MEYLMLAGAALLISAVGLLYFRLAEERLRELSAGETAAEEKTSEEAEEIGTIDLLYGDENSAPAAGRWRRALTICMFVCNVAAALFMRWFYQDLILDILTVVALCAVLWPCAWSDICGKLIPNRVLVIGLVIRLALLAAEALFLPEFVLYDLIRSAVAAAALLAVTMLCRLVAPNAIGFGDIKLLMLMGFYLGTDRVWGSVFFSMIIAFVYSLALLLMKRASIKSEIPFAPILTLGTVAAAFLTSV